MEIIHRSSKRSGEAHSLNFAAKIGIAEDPEQATPIQDSSQGSPQL
ncbi:hypothetical protein L195_g018265 [Trifolium pratense]|uniref:Uncharacterized protein n=1 Tax=Trifolium pratense TaxID=57577 RepID=A0A2K3MW96_TRIPR|nr:hypothetical protein L195_g018265 [Trifolium pratense]